MINFRHRGYDVTIERSAYPLNIIHDQDYYGMGVILRHKQLKEPFGNYYEVRLPFFLQITADAPNYLCYYYTDDAIKRMTIELTEDRFTV